MTMAGRIAVATLLTLTSPAALANSDDEVLERIQTAADQVLERVLEHREELEAHPEQIYDSVSDLVTAYFDFSAMTQAALGKYWPRADDRQRSEVVAEFRELLVRTYGSAVLKYSGKPIEYKGVRWSGDKQRALVSTRVEPTSGPAVPIDYKLHKAGGNWMVYDVTIDNISLVTNYRSSFANEIRNGGLDGLIEALRSRNAELKG